MLRSANTAILSRVSAVIHILASCAYTQATASEIFCIHIPGEGVVAQYPTLEQTEDALHHLPYSVRQRAVICDGDGCCLSR